MIERLTDYSKRMLLEFLVSSGEQQTKIYNRFEGGGESKDKKLREAYNHHLKSQDLLKKYLSEKYG